MGLFRVPLIRTETVYGFIEIEADDEGLAIDKALHMDRWALEDDDSTEWGSCGDETEIEVWWEDGAEDVTPASVSDGLWQ